MQIPDEIRRCVGFIGVKKPADAEPVPCGTFFVVLVPIGKGMALAYAITAAHVIDGVRLDGDGMVYLRLNYRGRSAIWLPSAYESWVFHDTKPGVDVAVARMAFPPDFIDYTPYPMRQALTPEIAARHQVDLGDEVFMPGLFVKRPGGASTGNIPIVRVGNIAAMPSAPLDWKRTTYAGEEIVTMDPPYLVETRSIGGLSGSPVFVNIGPVRMGSGGSVVSIGAGPTFYLMGLMHGHWDTDPEKDWSGPRTDSLAAEKVNMGIGIVVPVSSIQEVLDHPAEVAYRAEAAASLPPEEGDDRGE